MMMLAFAAPVVGAPAAPAASQKPADAKPTKMVFLFSGAGGHHPNEESLVLFKHCLEGSGELPAIRCEIYDRWPGEPAALDDAATVVIYSEGAWKGGRRHPVLTAGALKKLDGLMKKGTGAVLIHFSLTGAEKVEAPKMLAWIGGYYNFESRESSNRMSRTPVVYSPASPGHAVSRGWKRLTLPHNETYFKLWFAKGAVPILSGALVKAPKDPSENVVAWALQRAHGGRGFGYSGGHFYDNWLNDDLRKMILNAIVWTAKIEVPKEGVRSTVPEALRKPTKRKALQATKAKARE
jgi:hypothetical protein